MVAPPLMAYVAGEVAPAMDPDYVLRTVGSLL